MFEEGRPSARLLEVEALTLPELQREQLRLQRLRPSIAPGIITTASGAGLALVGAFFERFSTVLFHTLLIGGLAVAAIGIAVLVIVFVIRQPIDDRLTAVKARIRDYEPPMYSPPPLLQSTVFTF